jgi:[CysO sulfur-carrier protein]-S-L-cysteine hydrolase
MANADASATSYRLDPREQLEAENEMEDEDWQTMGIFHTHTHTEAYPSPTDQERAFWPPIGSEPRVAMFPDAYYLIMSLSDRSNPSLRAFRIHEIGRVDEEEVAIG